MPSFNFFISKVLSLDSYHTLVLSLYILFLKGEKECIILSLVRSDGDTDSPAGVAGAIGDDGSSRRFANGKNEVGLGKLLQDVRRMNGALTRAQSKLVIVGSKRTLLRR